MTKTIHFKIVTPEQVVYESEVEEVVLPTRAGVVGILPNHTPLVSLLVPGEMVVKKEGARLPFAVAGGVIEVRPKSEVVVLADSAERAEEIDLKRAEVARDRARKMLEEKEHLDDIQFAKLQAILDHEMARIKVHQKYRR